MVISFRIILYYIKFIFILHILIWLQLHRNIFIVPPPFSFLIVFRCSVPLLSRSDIFLSFFYIIYQQLQYYKLQIKFQNTLNYASQKS